MTNVEKKAQEFAENRGHDNQSITEAFVAALDMAEWKDEQYNEERKELLELVKMLKIDDHNQTIIEDLVAILNL